MEQCESFAAIHDDEVVAVATLMTIWPGRAHLSALLSLKAGSVFLGLHREVAKRLKASTVRRIEATVDGEWAEAHRWLRMLGFHLETPQGMTGYRPDGGTSYLYARIQ
jgi:hypothetical protein